MVSLVFSCRVMTLTITIPACRWIYSFKLCRIKSDQAPNPPIRFQTWWCEVQLHPSSLMCFSLHRQMDVGEGSSTTRPMNGPYSNFKNFYLIMTRKSLNSKVRLKNCCTVRQWVRQELPPCMSWDLCFYKSPTTTYCPCHSTFL